MTLYLLIAVVLLIAYLKRNDIKHYLDKEFSNIKGQHETDEETRALIAHYSAYRTEELIGKLNTENLGEKHVSAIKKVLTDRQVPPTSFFE